MKIAPIFEMKVGGLLGGVQNGKFVTAEKASKSVKVGDKLALYSFIGREEGEMKLMEFKNDMDFCTDFYYAKTDPEARSGIAVGSGMTWNLTPRIAKNISLTDKTYVGVIAAYLKTKKILKPRVKITQAMRVDLDGDGTEEVVLTATRYTGEDSSDAANGDYSFILVRKIVGKTVRNIFVAGEFYPKKAEFNAPNTYEVSAIADLNGDGKMELVMHSAYYEGSGSWAANIVGSKAVDIKELSVGCGV